MPMNLENKNYKLSFFLYFLIFGLLIELITVGIVYTLNYYEMLEQLRSKYRVESTVKQNLLKNATSGVEKSIDGILNNQIFLNYLKSQSSANRQAVQHLFYFISEENNSYMQVRYLDKNGIERIRVDRGQNTIVLDEKDLQSKADRYYFQDTMNANPKSFWYSNLDLNIENGKIETPYKPTLRIAKQVIDENSSKGIIIINLAMQSFLKQLITSSSFDIDLVDKDGNYIYSYNTKNSWSKDLKSNTNIKDDLKMASFKKGNFEENNVFFVQINEVIQSSQKPYLVFSEKYEIVQSLKRRNFYVTFWVVFIVLAISIPLALFISSIPLTLQKRLSEALRQLQKFSNIVDKYVMTIVLDSKKNIKSLSTAFSKKALYDKSELIGKNYSFIARTDQNKEQKKLSQKDLESKNMVFTTKKGNFVYVEQNTTISSPKNDENIEYMIILSDITEQKELERRSITDPLTKLYNRARIDQFLARETRLAKRHKNSLCVIMMDIDFFKKINDVYGHQVGDMVLVELAKILKNHIRSTDLAGRFGGEEFILILPQTDRKGGIIVAQELRKKIEAHIFLVQSKITASFGVANFKHEDDIHSLIKRADQALYKAKTNGRNRVC